MIKNDEPILIDFQGARIGPLQYDLASLLLDPYVGLSQDNRAGLLAYCMDRLDADAAFDGECFRKGYACCCVTRNLQMLGAFGHLTQNRGKSWFAGFIPAAASSLKENLSALAQDGIRLPRLQVIADEAFMKLNRNSERIPRSLLRG